LGLLSALLELVVSFSLPSLLGGGGTGGSSVGCVAVEEAAAAADPGGRLTLIGSSMVGDGGWSAPRICSV
jgi:hypothetical protein